MLPSQFQPLLSSDGVRYVLRDGSRTLVVSVFLLTTTPRIQAYCLDDLLGTREPLSLFLDEVLDFCNDARARALASRDLGQSASFPAKLSSPILDELCQETRSGLRGSTSQSPGQEG